MFIAFSFMIALTGKSDKALASFALFFPQLLDLMCQILQTDSIPACQAWLKAASDSGRYHACVAIVITRCYRTIDIVQ